MCSRCCRCFYDEYRPWWYQRGRTPRFEMNAIRETRVEHAFSPSFLMPSSSAVSIYKPLFSSSSLPPPRLCFSDLFLDRISTARRRHAPANSRRWKYMKYLGRCFIDIADNNSWYEFRPWMMGFSIKESHKISYYDSLCRYDDLV